MQSQNVPLQPSEAMKTASWILKSCALVGTLGLINPRVGFTNDSGIYVASCTFESVASIGLEGPRFNSFAGNMFSPLGMKVFGCG